MRVAVLAGGWSREREISLKSGKTVFEVLDRNKYHVQWFDPRDDLKALMAAGQQIDMAFILLHGRLGEDGRMQGLLDILNIPYVGSGVLASAMAFNKAVSKGVFRKHGLRVAADVVLREGARADVDRLTARLGSPLVIKPVSEGSSIGMCISGVQDEVERGIARGFSLGGAVMVEEYVAGREITCCVVGNGALEVLPVVEIRPREEFDFFDYEAKYTPGATEEVCPADISGRVTDRANMLARKAHRALGCAVWSRTDMIVRDEEIFVLETNTLPGMTETSLFPLAAKGAGWTFSELLDRLIELSFEHARRGK